MAKLTLNNINSGYASNTAINTNNDLIETALEKTLSRDGTSPNYMEADLDLNGYKVINLAAPVNTNDAARLLDIQNNLIGGGALLNGNASEIFNVSPATASTHAVAGSQLFGFRNKIINGGMSVYQRGAVTPALGSITNYTLDRWAAYQTGAALAISRTSGNGTDQKYALHFVGAVGNTECSLLQPIEAANCYELPQNAIQVSMWLYSDTAKTITIYLDTPTTTEDVFSATTVLPSGSSAISHTGSGWERATFTYSAALSSTNGTAIRRGLRLRIHYGACTTGNFGLTGVQIESGTLITPFEQRSYGTELSLCQRYLPCYTAYSSSTSLVGEGGFYSTSVGQIVYKFKTTPRIPPTGITVSAVGSFLLKTFGASVSSAATAIVFAASGYESCVIDVTGTATPYTANQPAYLSSNVAAAYIRFTGCEL